LLGCVADGAVVDAQERNPKDTAPKDNDNAEATQGKGACFTLSTSTGSACALTDCFKASSAFGGLSNRQGAFASNGYFYVLRRDFKIRAGKPQTDGSLTWEDAGEHGNKEHGFSVAGGDLPLSGRNGHALYYTRKDSGPALREDDMAPTLDAFGGVLPMWDSMIRAPFRSGKSAMYDFVSFDMLPHTYIRSVYSSVIDAQGKVRTYTFRGEYPGSPGKGAFVQPDGSAPGAGFIYTVPKGESTLFRTAVAEDASVGPFTDMQRNLPQGSCSKQGCDALRGDVFAIGRTLCTVRGESVFCVDVNADGSVTKTWQEVAKLPEPQIRTGDWAGELEANAWGVIGDYLYLRGPEAVYYAHFTKRECE